MSVQYLDIIFLSCITLFLAPSEVYGGEAKCIAESFIPLLPIMYPETGESIPPDKRSNPCDEDPTGSPPCPYLILSKINMSPFSLKSIVYS